MKDQQIHNIIDTTDFISLECFDCGVLFMMTNNYHNTIKKRAKIFYCPNGHTQNYVDDRVKLVNQIAEKDVEIKSLKSEILLIKSKAVSDEVYKKDLDIKNVQIQKLEKEIKSLEDANKTFQNNHQLTESELQKVSRDLKELQLIKNDKIITNVIEKEEISKFKNTQVTTEWPKRENKIHKGKNLSESELEIKNIREKIKAGPNDTIDENLLKNDAKTLARLKIIREQELKNNQKIIDKVEIKNPKIEHKRSPEEIDKDIQKAMAQIEKNQIDFDKTQNKFT